MRRATRGQRPNWPECLFLSTLSLRRATLNRPPPLTSRTISIHALLAESDSRRQRRQNRPNQFLSTLSLRRATVHYDNYNLHCTISIHALLAESDTETPHQAANSLAFLSTLSLRRATRYSLRRSASNWHFYPRSPCGERPRGRQPALSQSSISIHALLAESD